MKNIVLGLGEYDVINQTDDLLKTYALGSCVAVILIDLRCGVAGMVHVVLPDSSLDPKKGITNPGHFADTAIPVLIKLMRQKGSVARIQVKLVGGASTIIGKDSFQIGKRNILSVKKHLWKHRMGAIAEEVGGDLSRTVSVDTKGQVIISSPKIADRII